MFPNKEMKIIRQILADETYHIPIQEKFEQESLEKYHQPKKEEDKEYWKDLFDDKILGILGG